MSDSLDSRSAATVSSCGVAELVPIKVPIPVVALPGGYGLLPLTLSIGQVIAWTGLKKTKVQELANEGELITSKVSGRTLWLTSSVIALVDRHRTWTPR